MYIVLNSKKIRINKINKTIGLMFKKKKITEGYIFKNCNAIHTFFMRQNIAVIMTDKNYKILLINNNISKNKIIICKNAFFTFELPVNSYLNNIKIGDILKTVE